MWIVVWEITGYKHIKYEKSRITSYNVCYTKLLRLLLENSLIKQHQPKYNILLKDDKTYPSIVIKKENFPRVFKTRNIIHDGSTYFGPYSSASVVNNMLDLASYNFV